MGCLCPWCTPLRAATLAAANLEIRATCHMVCGKMGLLEEQAGGLRGACPRKVYLRLTESHAQCKSLCMMSIQ